MFELAAGEGWLVSLIRTTIFPPLANLVTSIDAVKRRLFKLVSQIIINYRDFSLSKHTEDEADDVKAGDRLPYFVVDGESIFHKLNEPKFHLLVFSNGEPEQTICKDLEREFNDVVDCQVVPLDQRVKEIFEKETDFIVFLRPDNHIGFISEETGLGRARAYLKDVIGRRQV